MGALSESDLFSELTLRGHNLCWECPISKLKVVFSSCLVVLQYGVVLISKSFCFNGCSLMSY